MLPHTKFWHFFTRLFLSFFKISKIGVCLKYRDRKNMPRSNVKYEIARDEGETCDYYLQHIQEFQNVPKKESTVYRKALQGVSLITVYFVLSIGLTFYQKWVFDDYGLKFPLGVVSCHLVIKFLLSALVRFVRQCRNHRKQQQQMRLPWQTLVCTLAPPGIASGLDIGLSNWAISLITMSLYTMSKSTTIVFILGFSLVFNLEKKSWTLVGIVTMISSGLFMFTYKSVQFNVLGFILCLLASFSSGLRWTMAQLIMQRSKLGLRNPVDMMFHMQPWMLLAIVPVTLKFEGYAIYEGFTNTDWSNYKDIFYITTAVLSGAVLAFCMEITEFMVVTYTSSLTLSITGIVKEIFTLILAYEWKGDQMSGLNFVGLLLCLGGIVLHVIQKVLVNKRDKNESLELQSNSVSTTVSSTRLKSVDEHFDDTTNLPLLTQKSTSLTNLLNSTFSSDEDDDDDVTGDKNDDDSSQILTDILQRRE